MSTTLENHWSQIKDTDSPEGGSQGLALPCSKTLIFQLTTENINHTPKDFFWTEITLNVYLSS